MLSFFRRVSKSKIGTGVMAFVLVAILAGFAVADLSNFGSGKIGFGMSSGTLAKVGDQEVTEREMSDAMQRRLQDARQQRPDADYASIIGDFDPLLDALLDRAHADGVRRQIRLPAVEAADRRGDRADSRTPRVSTASSASRPISNS